jgi:hypothetical protein
MRDIMPVAGGIKGRGMAIVGWEGQNRVWKGSTRQEGGGNIDVVTHLVHLAQRSVLAADRGNILNVDLAEPFNVCRRSVAHPYGLLQLLESIERERTALTVRSGVSIGRQWESTETCVSKRRRRERSVTRMKRGKVVGVIRTRESREKRVCVCLLCFDSSGSTRVLSSFCSYLSPRGWLSILPLM